MICLRQVEQKYFPENNQTKMLVRKSDNNILSLKFIFSLKKSQFCYLQLKLKTNKFIISTFLLFLLIFLIFTHQIQFIILYKYINIMSDEINYSNAHLFKDTSINQIKESPIERQMKRNLFQINKKFLIMLGILILQIKYVNAISSNGMSLINHPNLQTHMVTLTLSNTITRTGTLTFRKQKKSLIGSGSIFFGIASMDSNLNFFDPSTGYVRLKYDLTITGITLTNVNFMVSHLINTLKRMALSVLIISNQFQYVSYFRVIQASYTQGNNWLQSLTLPYAMNTVTMVPFLTGCDLPILGSQIQYSIYFYLNADNITFYTQINYYGGPYLSSFTLKIRYLFYYYNQLNPQIYDVSLYVMSYTSYSLIQTLQLVDYQGPKSNMIVGFNTFGYTTTTDSNPGFAWTGSWLNLTTMQLSMDDQFYWFGYFGLVINYYGCEDKIFAVKSYNPSSGMYECFDQCFPNQYLYYNTINQQYVCKPCDQLCLTCDQQTTCTDCIIGYSLGPNRLCLLNTTYYLLSSTSTSVDLCSSHIGACAVCDTYGTVCLQCWPSYYLTGLGTCGYCPSLVTYCNRCTSAECLQCDLPYVLLAPDLCGLQPPPFVPDLPCSSTRCKTCLQSALDECLQCHSTVLVIQDGKCISLCGDGLVLDHQVCDDGNILPYDGCSSDCLKVQDGFKCSALILGGRSQCYYDSRISLSKISITKELTQNKLNLVLKNSATKIREWMTVTQLELASMLKFTVPRFQTSNNAQKFNFKAKFLSSSSLSRSQNRLLQSSQDLFNPDQFSYLFLQIIYQAQNPQNTESLNHHLSQIVFAPNLSNRTVFNTSSALASSLTFSLVQDNNNVIQYFDSEYYQNFNIVEVASLGISVLTILMLILAMIAYFLDGNNGRQMLVTLETAFIVQFTYFSLLGIGQLNPLFVAMAQGLKYSAGFDINSIDSYAKSRQLRGLSIESSNAINNINISILLPLSFAIAGSIVFLVNKCKTKKTQEQLQQYHQQINNKHKQSMQSESSQEQIKSNKLSKVSKILICNFGFGMFMFFLYKYFFFIFVQLKFGLQNMVAFDVIVIVLVMVMLVVFIVTIFARFELYQFLTDKVSVYKASEDEEELQSTKNRKRRTYFMLIICEHFVNCLALVLLYDTKFHGLATIVLYMIHVAYISFYHKNIYNPTHKIRLYFNYLIGIIIQILLLVRKSLTNSVQNQIGQNEINFGLYLPFSLLIILFCLLLNNIIFQIYSIKRIRCCQLQMEWEKVNTTLKQKFQVKKVLADHANLIKQDINKNSISEIKIAQNLKFETQNKKLQNQKSNESKKSKYNHRDHQSIITKSNTMNNENYEQRLKDIEVINDVISKIENFGDQEALKKQTTFKSQCDDVIVKDQGIMNIQNPHQQNGNGLAMIRRQIKKQIKNKMLDSRISNVQKIEINSNLINSPLPKQDLSQVQDLNNSQRNLMRSKIVNEKRKQKKYVYTNEKKYDFYDQYNEI